MTRKTDRRLLLSHGLAVGVGLAGGWFASKGFWPGSSPSLLAAEESASPENRLKELGLTLPSVTTPRATLVPAVRVGELLHVSGHLPPPIDGKPQVGKVGKDFTLEQGQEAARNIGLVILAVVRRELGSLDKVVRLVKTFGMVNCTPEFTQQPQVINGFSDLMVQVFGEKSGKGARSAVGMASLPAGAPVEVECIFQVRS
ncbi:MAG: RidA family protein [Gemmataceae bacterium]